MKTSKTTTKVKTSPSASHTVVKNLERGEKTKMIAKLLKRNKTVGEVRAEMAKKGINVYDSEVRRVMNKD